MNSTSWFSGKNVLITGATGGLGSALAVEMNKLGAHLWVTASHASALDELCARLAPDEPLAAIAADLSRPEEVHRLAQSVRQQSGGIDALINIAGVGYYAFMEEAVEDKVRHLFEVNTIAPLMLIQELLPHMKSQHSGRIINVVTAAGRVPIPTAGVYGGTKSALAIMANTMRLELAGSGVEVINIYPGTIDTAFEENAMRERNLPGLCSEERCGRPRFDVARKVLQAAEGPAGEVWLERQGKFMSVAALMLPKWVDRLLAGVGRHTADQKPDKPRRWRLLQVESAIACNLKCIMCPWRDMAHKHSAKGLMAPEVWAAVVPHLDQVQSVDFTGGGEPLMQPHIVEWVRQASEAGCETGLLTNGTLLTEDKAKQLIDAGIDWICVSMDGATAEVFETIRPGASFKTVCRNVKALTGRRIGKRPRVAVNCVMMPQNADQLEEMVVLADELGVDQINFKQCDVIRGDAGKGFALFADKHTKETRRMEKLLRRAVRLAKKKHIETTTFAWVPEELPVCAQDPRNSMFIRHDGRVAPCINLALGGPTTFLGKAVEMPSVHYGQLPDASLSDLWATERCQFYRKRFELRMSAYESGFARSDLEASLTKIKEALDNAQKAMPSAPEGCRVCHYLYNI
ncbi:MAG: SDR family NAD(P)-dependent oxidoreductase [Desulfobacteraceae bacterium]